MKKSLPVLILLPLVLLAACQNTAPRYTVECFRGADTPEEMLALFQRYWNLGEDAETGDEFMRRFKQEPALALKTLTLATGSEREQMLILIGSRIADAKRNDQTAYAQYSAALETAAASGLDEDSARMLTFIHANIEYWYNH